jgi:hypothetical protein
MASAHSPRNLANSKGDFSIKRRGLVRGDMVSQRSGAGVGSNPARKRARRERSCTEPKAEEASWVEARPDAL